MSNPSTPSRNPSQDRLTRFVCQVPDWLGAVLDTTGPLSTVILMVIGLVLAIPLIVTPLSLSQQSILAVLFIGAGWLLVRLEQRYAEQKTSERLHLLLVWLSLFVTTRYLYYRTFNTLNFDGLLNSIFSLLLYAAELYAIATLALAYFQTLKTRDRQPIDMTAIPLDQWPIIDIYIPTYNEDVEIVRKTALAALAIDYPDHKKQVYVLDDGRKFPERREELRYMCEELGCYLMTRDNNDHAKAGNINHAMLRTKGDLILILDCDHIPARCILQQTVGFFLNPKVSLVQTPHWFYNPDPFERNLLTQGKVPVGNELFYKVLQKGNDFWNAAFFCGSAAVIRKKHLLEVGGIAVETVTEDCHTSLRLHTKGYETVYYDKIMVAGLAPEKFSAYIGQQVRWARGMAQILRIEWPMFNSNLTWAQRICYTSATSHFFFGFPRLMYAIAPVAFLLFGINSVRGLGLETLTYALPSIVLALNANYVIYKGVRFSFWNEIFEYALAFQDGLVTFMAMVNPKLGSFNVTDKGLTVSRRTFDFASVNMLMGVFALSIISLIAVPYWLLTGFQDSDAVLINAVWCVLNVALIIAAILVALEQPQLRQAHRLDRNLRVTLYSGDRTFYGTTKDVSESGAQIYLSNWPNLPDLVEVELSGDTVTRVNLKGRIVRVSPQNNDEVIAALVFEDLTPKQKDDLILVLFSDVNEWYSQSREEQDNPWQSILFLLTSLVRAFRSPQVTETVEVRKQIKSNIELYAQGHYFQAVGREINSRTLKLMLSPQNLSFLHPEILSKGQPVGLIIGAENSQDPIRLIAQVDEIEQTGNGTNDTIVEVSFPQVLDIRQQEKVDYLLHAL